MARKNHPKRTTVEKLLARFEKLGFSRVDWDGKEIIAWIIGPNRRPMPTNIREFRPGTKTVRIFRRLRCALQNHKPSAYVSEIPKSKALSFCEAFLTNHEYAYMKWDGERVTAYDEQDEPFEEQEYLRGSPTRIAFETLEMQLEGLTPFEYRKDD